jgi:hypothetical protein
MFYAAMSIIMFWITVLALKEWHSGRSWYCTGLTGRQLYSRRDESPTAFWWGIGWKIMVIGIGAASILAGLIGV